MTATPGCFFLGLLVLVLVNSARWFDTVAWMLLSVAVSTSCIVMLRLISGRITSLNISYLQHLTGMHCCYPPHVSMEAYVYWLLFFLSVRLYLGDGGTDRCEILHVGTYRSRTDLLPFWGGTPGSPNPKFWA